MKVQRGSIRIIWLGTCAIVAVALVTYLPALKIQFYDGWWYLRWAATMDLPRYLIQFFDPANITQGYRPVQGLYIYLLYQLFGFDPDGYHIAHTLLHAANSILLFIIVWRLGKNWRVAFVAGILYAVLPTYTLAVFWHAVVDPLAGFFYLLTILIWTRYLCTGHKLDWALTLGAYILALLSKEISIFLPLMLFLIEWWFFHRQPSRQRIWQYIPFLIAIFPYLWLVLQVQSHGEFAGQFGFRIGPHMLSSLIPYLAILTFPWATEFPAQAFQYIWLAVVTVVYSIAMLRGRNTALLFLAVFAILNISPVLGFPLDYFNTRYLYLSVMSSVILLAIVIEKVWQFFAEHRSFGILAAAILALVIVLSGQRVAEAATDLAEYTRQVRVPFRDVVRNHPSFPEDTYLYFVYSPVASVWDLEGLSFVRYGNRVTVNGTETGHSVNLSNHNVAYVYYFDPTGRPIELPVDKSISTRAMPSLPVRFEIPITLEHYEVPSGKIERGKALVIILNWRTASKIVKDHTVFAHLVDSQGNIVSSFDSPPARGKAPTSEWELGRLLVDAIVLPVNPDVPIADNCRLEIGLYDQASGKRLSIVDANGQRIGDTVVIEPFKVVE